MAESCDTLSAPSGLCSNRAWHLLWESADHLAAPVGWGSGVGMRYGVGKGVDGELSDYEAARGGKSYRLLLKCTSADHDQLAGK